MHSAALPDWSRLPAAVYSWTLKIDSKWCQTRTFSLICQKLP